MKTVPLGEVAQINMGSAPPSLSYNSVGAGVPLIAGAGDFGKENPVQKKWTTEPTRITEIGDLIVCVRATIGNLNWANKKYCLGRGVAGIRSKNAKIELNFAFHYINSKKNELVKLGTGSTFLAIRKADLEKFPFPDLGLKEQKRIAAILDKADGIRKKREKALQLADSFLRATFLEMFGDPVTNPKGWDSLPLKELGKVSTGTTPSGQKNAMFGTEIPFVTPGDLETDTITKRFLTKEGAENSRTVRKGATFVCCIGTIGKIDIAKNLSAFNQQINAVEWNEYIKDDYGLWAMKFIKKILIC